MIHKFISERKSIRAFADKPIDDEILIKLFEAARWAPSSMNEQPWRFIVSPKDKKNSFEKTLSCLNESNQVWAKYAAVLIVVLAKTNFSDKHVPNIHAFHDVGLAVGNISFQATASNLFIHQMGGIDKEKIRLLFEIPSEYEIVSVIAGGYKGDHGMLPENLQWRESMPRMRKNLDDLIFSDTFGKKCSSLNKKDTLDIINNKSA